MEDYLQIVLLFNESRFYILGFFQFLALEGWPLWTHPSPQACALCVINMVNLELWPSSSLLGGQGGTVVGSRMHSCRARRVEGATGWQDLAPLHPILHIG